jgi:cysteine synthase A
MLAQPSHNPLLDRMIDLGRLLRPTPLARLHADGLELFAKLETTNPMGSVKDRPAYWMLRQAILRGEIHSGTTLVESSSGNFAVALSFFCKQLGLPFIAVIDPNISAMTEATLLANCSRVEKVDRTDGSGGYLKTRIARVSSLLQSIPGAYWPNQYENPDAMEAHYRFTGAEIAGAFSALDYAFIGVSSAGTIAGVSRRLKEKFPRVKVIAVDVEGSVIFGAPPSKRVIPGIGAGIVPSLLSRARVDDHVIVSELETIDGCHELMNRHGLFLGGSSGSAYAAIQKYFRRHRPTARPSVVFLAADRGIAYLNTVYSDAWVDELRSRGKSKA